MTWVLIMYFISLIAAAYGNSKIGYLVDNIVHCGGMSRMLGLGVRVTIGCGWSFTCWLCWYVTAY